MILWAAIGAVAFAALAALVALAAFWRKAGATGRAMEALDMRIAELSLRLERDRAARREEEIAVALGGVRDDVAILSTHVSAMTGGQLDIKRVVTAAVSREVAPLLERLEEADCRSSARAVQVNERLETALQAAARLAGDHESAEARRAALSALEARIDALAEHVHALAERAPEPDPALARMEERLDALAAKIRETPDMETTRNAVTAAMEAGLDRILDERDERRAQAARRAPRIFDNGRVVTLVAPQAGARAAERA
jgi:chromosome segregation ATPase